MALTVQMYGFDIDVDEYLKTAEDGKLTGGAFGRNLAVRNFLAGRAKALKEIG